MASQSNGVSQAPDSDLVTMLEQLGLNSVPTHPKSYPSINPSDLYRAHIAEILVPLTGASLETVFKAISWASTLDKGDLQLPVNALRLKGRKPDELARSIVEQVSFAPDLGTITESVTDPLTLSSSQTRRSSGNQSPMAHSSSFISPQPL